MFRRNAPVNRTILVALRGICVSMLLALLAASVATSQTNPVRASAASTRARHVNAPKEPGAPAATREDLEKLREMITSQSAEDQRRIDELQQENQRLVEQLKVAEQQLAHASEQIEQMHAEQVQQITSVESAVTALKKAEADTTVAVQQEQKAQQDAANPASLRYRGITLTPGGYFAAEGLYRSHAENADINTSWASIPYEAQSMSYLGEFRATARATRLSLRADGALGRATATGYFETDFLASGFGASEVQTNGYSNRVRQMWGRAQFPGGWTIAAGQMWSLLTTNRVGIENLSEMTPALIDATVLPGFDYARQTALRVTRRFDANKMAVACSAENAATVGVTPANVPSSVSGNISGLSATGTGIMSNTTYSTNVAPDLIAKLAFDPGFGHFEIRVIGRTFRDRINATATAPGKNNTITGGAIGGAAYVPVWTNKINYLAQASWGAIGRYGATSTDVVVKPDGSLSVEKSIHGISGFDTHPSSRLDWYAYASAEYLPRDYGYGLKTIDNTKCFVETGFSCSASLRNLQEASTGIWYRFYKGPSGTLQYGANYIYVVKNTWVGVKGAPRGVDDILETSFRYYIP